jgi:hypothetical protein
MLKIDYKNEDEEMLIFSFQVEDENVQGITNFIVDDEVLYLDKLHLQGSEPGKVGIYKLREMAKDLGRHFQAKKVVIQGGKRTTGKYKGQIPSPITINIE